MLELGKELMRHIAKAIDKSEYYFEEWFNKDSLSRMRSIYYKPRPINKEKNNELSEH